MVCFATSFKISYSAMLTFQINQLLTQNNMYVSVIKSLCKRVCCNNVIFLHISGLVGHVMQVIKLLSERWNSYKYRFVPWMRLKLPSQTTTRVTDVNSDKVISDAEVLSQLKCLFKSFDNVTGSGSKFVPHRLEVRESSIKGAGLGVYLASCDLPKGMVAALYPGTVYLPYESIFFQSVSNQYIFKCSDGMHIDGNNRGLSKMVYRSCEGRDRLSPQPVADLSWIESLDPVVCINVGQFVNNRSRSKLANVCYQEFDFPVDFDRHLRKYIPNVFYKGGNLHLGMRTVVLVTTRDLLQGEELLSTYYTVIKT